MTPTRLPTAASRRSPSGAPSRWRLLLALPGLLFGLAAAAQPTSDDSLSSGIFVTPGFPPRTAVPPSFADRPATPGAALPADPALRRAPTSLVGSDAARRGGRSGSGADAAADDRTQRRGDGLLPPPPTEFQKFVETSTGRLLPIFGAEFFAATADGASPLDNVPVTADYVVGPGDEIVMRAWGAIDVDYRAIVDRNGQISLPKVGTFTVAGVKASDLEKQLRAQIGRLYTNFNLSVSLGQLRGVKVFVVGPAQRPGVYTLPAQSTLLAAVVAAGGPGPNGSMRRISLRRDGRIVSELDVYDFLVQGDKSKDMQLAAGDVVVIRPAGPRVAVAGTIDNPAIYELRGRDEPLRDVLRYAGGTPVLASPSRAHLERIDTAQRPARYVDELRLDADGLQKPLRDGDVLTLLPISPQFANAVTLRGHVAQPLRYPYKPGMRIRDLIPDKEALISPGFYRRKNLLVQVIEPDDESLTPSERQRVFDRERRAAALMARGSASPATTTGLGGAVLPGRADARGRCPGRYRAAPPPARATCPARRSRSPASTVR